VARLHLHDGAGGAEHLLGLDHRRGPVVGAHPGVLEDVRELQERLLVGERAAEVDAGLLDRLAAGALDRRGERVDVLGLVVAELAKLIGDHEVEHVDALSATISDLGGKPVKAPKVDFGDAFSSQDAFLALAVTFEDTGVSAYNGAAPMIESKELLATAGAIVQIEGRHAAAVRFAAGEEPAPNAFDPTLTVDEVLKAVEPFVG